MNMNVFYRINHCLCRYSCSSRRLLKLPLTYQVTRAFSVSPLKSDTVINNKKTFLNKKHSNDYLNASSKIASISALLQPYIKLARLNRPMGNWTLIWPSICGVSLPTSAGCFPDPNLLLLFTLGSIIMRAGADTLNDFLDADVDREVKRTSSRPLAVGDLSNKQVFGFLSLELLLALMILLNFNTNTIVLGAASLVPMAFYPCTKRFTYWPQLFLGITINWGALMGWCAVTGEFTSLPCLTFYAGCIFWSLYYDTIYAHQDKIDDARIGVYSTALLFNENTKLYLTGFVTAMVCLFQACGQQLNLAWPCNYSISLGYLILLSSICKLDLDSSLSCQKAYNISCLFGAFLFFGILAGNYFRCTN